MNAEAKAGTGAGAALVWAVLVCLGAGAAAVAAGWPSIWGGRVTLTSYALPFPTTAGMLHLPGLAVGVAAIVVSRARRRRGAMLAALGVGMIAAGGLLSWDPGLGRWDRMPPALFMFVDGLGLVAFAPFLRGAPGDRPLPRLAVAGALAAPVAAALALQLFLHGQSARWSPARSGWDAAAGLETLDYFPTRNRRMPRTLAQACALLAGMAADPYPGQGPPGGWPKRHRVLRLFASMQASLGADARALVVYEWWPDRPEGRCTDAGFGGEPR